MVSVSNRKRHLCSFLKSKCCQAAKPCNLKLYKPLDTASTNTMLFIVIFCTVSLTVALIPLSNSDSRKSLCTVDTWSNNLTSNNIMPTISFRWIINWTTVYLIRPQSSVPGNNKHWQLFASISFHWETIHGGSKHF